VLLEHKGENRIQVSSTGKAYDHITGLLDSFSSKAKVVVELGCGSKQYRSCFNGRYVGLDIRSVVYLGNRPDIFADAQTLPFKDESVDLIFVVASLLIIPDTDKVISECFRVLRDSGQVVIFDYNRWVSKRLQRQDKYHLHSFSSRRLIQKLAMHCFETRVHWSCVPVKGPWVVKKIVSIKFIKILTYFISNWVIVSGKKRIS
tara:strand:+ start:204 stop:812 length:609 start_codon:yes stop_codon:yes gene_type:complete